MEEESSVVSRSWEEEMYWKHFQYTHFSQFLLPGYTEQLAMPKTFYGNQRKKLPDRVTLKGPGGNTWEVGLTTKSGTLLFDQGWAEFVQDHGLKEHDLLVFKYNGVSHFEVLIFDGETFCETASCYFVNKSKPRPREDLANGCQPNVKLGANSSGTPIGDHVKATAGEKTAKKDDGEASCENASSHFVNKSERREDPGNGCHPKRKLGGNSTRVIFATPISQVKATSVEKTVEEDIGTVPLSGSVEHHIVWEATNIKKMKNSNGPSLYREVDKSGEPSCSADMEKERDVDNNTPLSFRVVHDVPYISLKKPATEEEKDKALRLAQEVVTSDGFYAVMKPTHVYRRFFMSIPNVWISKHLNMLLKCGVILKMKDKTWKTNFSYQESRKSGGLSAGWRSFVVENHLEEFDVCVFEPAAPFCTSVVLEVNIVRAIQDN